MAKRLKMAGKLAADTGDRRADVARLYQEGYKQTEIADKLGITQARVSQIMVTIERRRTNKRAMLRMMRPAQTAGASA